MENRERAERIIREHVLWSIGAGLVPIPVLDIVAVTGIQLDMMKQLSTLYGVSFSESAGKSWLSAMAGSILARVGANALKFLPGIGSLIGGVSMSILSGASTYAMGQVVMNHFESNGDFSNLDLDAAKRTFEQELERGKQVASKLKDEKDSARDVFEKLEKLAKLKEKGIITDEEFETQKKKMLETL